MVRRGCPSGRVPLLEDSPSVVVEVLPFFFLSIHKVLKRFDVPVESLFSDHCGQFKACFRELLGFIRRHLELTGMDTFNKLLLVTSGQDVNPVDLVIAQVSSLQTPVLVLEAIIMIG